MVRGVERVGRVRGVGRVGRVSGLNSPPNHTIITNLPSFENKTVATEYDNTKSPNTQDTEEISLQESKENDISFSHSTPILKADIDTTKKNRKESNKKGIFPCYK